MGSRPIRFEGRPLDSEHSQLSNSLQKTGKSKIYQTFKMETKQSAKGAVVLKRVTKI